MKILIVGGGGREHALTWKIAKSPKVNKIYCAPGNAGMAEIAECVNIAAENVDGLLAFAEKNSIDLTVVGPEAPLAAGIVDKFRAHGLSIFGPTQKAAYIEGSKALAKEIMVKYNIPTAAYGDFTDLNEALDYVRKVGAPIVVKADGLAAGKGVIVAMDMETALAAVKDILGDKKFGNAGSRVIIEEYLEGEEVSVLAFTDGKTVIPMVSSQDHKRIFDGDRGPNTGGMGAYSPAPVYTEEMAVWVNENILQATVNAMAAEGRLYEGILYAGLMLTTKGIKVLEYNARFGDPETQAILVRLETDLVEIIKATIDHKLADMQVKWSSEPAVCVVMAAGGYPEKYVKGDNITGLAEASKTAIVFHAGTALNDGKVVTAGGRVLGITAKGETIKAAVDNAYKAVTQINFQNAFYRKDIAYRALNR